jgi:alanyl-tRNA synthetase
VAGDAARKWAEEEAARQQEKFHILARKKPGITALPTLSETAETGEILHQIDARIEHLGKLEAEVHDWEKKNAKAAEAANQSRAAEIANELAAASNGNNFCVAEVKEGDGKLLQAVVDALKTRIKGPIVLAGSTDGGVALIASVPKELTAKFQADKLIQQIAPIVGGKGGGRPEGARGAGEDASKIWEALDEARKIIGAKV